MLSYSNAVIILVIIAGFALIGTAVMNLSSAQQTATAGGSAGLKNTQANYEKFVSAELSDKCAVPPGYTEEDWKTHMSHHPDRYEGCL
jgi:hypothetical protein